MIVEQNSSGRSEIGRLAIVIVNYGSSDLIEANLSALSEIYPVLVVDNYSDHRERERVEAAALRHGWSLLAMEVNLGFAAAVNAGARRAFHDGFDSVLLVNPDVTLSTDAVRELHEEVRADPMRLVAPRVLRPSGAIYFSGSWLDMRCGRITSRWPSKGAPKRFADRWGPRPEQLWPWVSGAVTAVSRQLFELLDGMDESYFLYWEDVDWSIRTLALGGGLVVMKDTVAVHDEGGTQGSRRGPAKSDIYYYQNCRNRLLFGLKHVSRTRLLVWILLTPVISWGIVLQGGRRQLLYSVGPLVAALRGSLAGVKMATAALFNRDAYQGKAGM